MPVPYPCNRCGKSRLEADGVGQRTYDNHFGLCRACHTEQRAYGNAQGGDQDRRVFDLRVWEWFEREKAVVQ